MDDEVSDRIEEIWEVLIEILERKVDGRGQRKNVSIAGNSTNAWLLLGFDARRETGILGPAGGHIRTVDLDLDDLKVIWTLSAFVTMNISNTRSQWAFQDRTTLIIGNFHSDSQKRVFRQFLAAMNIPFESEAYSSFINIPVKNSHRELFREYNAKFKNYYAGTPERALWFCGLPGMNFISDWLGIDCEYDEDDEDDEDVGDEDGDISPNSSRRSSISSRRSSIQRPTFVDSSAQMNLVSTNLKKRALELDEEEESRKRSRRSSDPRIQKCENLNKVCTYQPLDMEDWCEHDERYVYGPDFKQRCFDAIELLRHFESNLTATKYSNPYPQYPHDPFSREYFTLSQLSEFIDFCENANINVKSIAPTFARFLAYADNLTDPSRIDGKPFTPDVMDDVINNVIYSRQSGGSPFAGIFRLFGLVK